MIRRQVLDTLLCVALVVTPASRAMAHEGHGSEDEQAPARATGRLFSLTRIPDGSINAPKVAQRRMGIRTVLAPVTKAAASMQLPGQVVMDPNAGGRVQATHGGRLEPGPNGLPVAGQAVRKGQVLAYLRHHAEPFAEANQRAEAADLRAKVAIAEQRVKRLESLEGTVPQKEIDAARAELAGLRQRERAVGGAIGARETLVAPVSGVVAHANAAIGQVVDEKDVLFEIIDPRRLLVEASAAEPAQASRVASATLAGIEGVTLSVIGVGRTMRDGRVPITFRTESRNGAPPVLALGQPVTVVALTKDSVEGVVLPAEAVVRNAANEPVVYVKVGAERFVPQPVVFQPIDARTVVVTKGLARDHRVVVQGASMLNQIR